MGEVMTSINHHITLSLFHVIVIAPFLLYIAFVRGQLPPWIFTMLQGLGLVLLIYHSYKTMIRWRAHSSIVWINILHVITVAPLLLYIGSRGYDTPRWAYEVLAMLAFAALGYHLYNIVINVQEMFDHDKKLISEKRNQETNPHA